MSDTAAQAALRAEARAFLGEELRTGGFEPSSDAWMTGFEPAFTQRLAARGWVGMTLPTEYGGAAASALDRVVVVEELLAAGAPVAAHWFAERQIGPAILKHGTDAQRAEWLPRITAGDAYFAIGLSEPGSGSDLASVRTRAVRVEDGWALTGTKVWSSGAHRAHAMVVLARSGEGSRRHEGLTQFIVRLPDPRVTISPIVSISGAHHFNEVVLDAAFVPDSMVLGQVGGAWTQVVSELAYERSGPERFLSTMPLLERLAQLTSPGDTHGAEVVGSLVSSLSALRAMSLDVAHAIERGEPPVVAAAMVKDVGTIFEQDSVAVAAARLRDIPADAQAGYTALLDQAQIQSPNFTLRGGTNEVLRGIVAKELLSAGWAPPEASGLLFETVTQMLRDTAEAGTANVLDAVWPLLVDAELPWVGVSEAAGGAGGDTADLVAILSAAAGAGRSIPLSDSAFVANWLLDIAGLPVNRIIAIPLLQPDRPLRVDHDGALATVSGRFRSVTWAAVAAEFVAVAVGADGPVVVRLPASAATLGTGTGTGTPGSAGMTLAGEPWADVVLDQAPVLDTGPLPPGSGPLDALARAALGAAVSMSAAMDAAVLLSVRYAAQREQFGRPIGQFQAVAHRLALIAGEAAAARAAVGAALRSTSAYSAGAAKARAGVAAAEVARGAHQIHGAMGVSAEYPLGRLTTRLWAWSRAHGDAPFWNRLIGSRAIRAPHPPSGALWQAVERLGNPDTGIGAGPDAGPDSAPHW